jgi:PAS domain S-box-containing protein
MAPDGVIFAASPALVQLLGYASLDELRARNSDGGEYDSEYVQALFARHSGQIDDIESVWRRKDGSIIHVRESARAIYDDQGRPTEYDGIIEKIVGPGLESREPRTAEPQNRRTAEPNG